MWESYVSKRESGTIRGNLSMYMKSLLRFSLVTVAMSTTSLLSVNTQRSPEFTLFRLSRQNGHDCDIVRLQKLSNHFNFQLDRKNTWSTCWVGGMRQQFKIMRLWEKTKCSQNNDIYMTVIFQTSNQTQMRVAQLVGLNSIDQKVLISNPPGGP